MRLEYKKYHNGEDEEGGGEEGGKRGKSRQTRKVLSFFFVPSKTKEKNNLGINDLQKSVFLSH